MIYCILFLTWLFRKIKSFSLKSHANILWKILCHSLAGLTVFISWPFGGHKTYSRCSTLYNPHVPYQCCLHGVERWLLINHICCYFTDQGLEAECWTKGLWVLSCGSQAELTWSGDALLGSLLLCVEGKPIWVTNLLWLYCWPQIKYNYIVHCFLFDNSFAFYVCFVYTGLTKFKLRLLLRTWGINWQRIPLASCSPMCTYSDTHIEVENPAFQSTAGSLGALGWSSSMGCVLIIYICFLCTSALWWKTWVVPSSFNYFSTTDQIYP